MSVMSFTGKTLSPHLMFHNAASNIICQVLFGTRYEYDDHFIKEIVRCFTENGKISNGPWAMVSQRWFKFLLLDNYHCFDNFSNCLANICAFHSKEKLSFFAFMT